MQTSRRPGGDRDPASKNPGVRFSEDPPVVGGSHAGWRLEADQDPLAVHEAMQAYVRDNVAPGIEAIVIFGGRVVAERAVRLRDRRVVQQPDPGHRLGRVGWHRDRHAHQ